MYLGILILFDVKWLCFLSLNSAAQLVCEPLHSPILVVILLTTCFQFLWSEFEEFDIGSTRYPLDWHFSLFSSLVCLILYWYCKEKFCLGHSWGEQALISTVVRSAKLWEKNWLGATLLIKAYSCAIVESPWVTSLWKWLSLERRIFLFFWRVANCCCDLLSTIFHVYVY